MTLKREIQDLRARVMSQIPEAAARVMQQATEELVRSGISGRALTAGDLAPDFTLPDIDGAEINLSQELEEGPVVISFYRGGWCPYCNLELRALQRVLPHIRSRQAKLLAIAPERAELTQELRDKAGLDFPLLHDQGNHVACAFGLVFTLPEALRPLYAQFGIDLPASNGDDSFELPMPATYIIDRNRRIVHAFVDADYTRRMEPEEILEVLDHVSG